jgi:hypothetical protein
VRVGREGGGRRGLGGRVRAAQVGRQGVAR